MCICKTVSSLTSIDIDIIDSLMLLAIFAVTDTNPMQIMLAYFALVQGMMAIHNAMQLDNSQFVLNFVILKYLLDVSRMLASFTQLQYCFINVIDEKRA